MEKKIIVEAHYFPCIQFFYYALRANTLILESNENFQKQTYRNRCHILTAQGTMRLTVPLVFSNKTPIKEVLINSKENWINHHWKSITTAYRKTPFFEEISEYFKEVLFKGHEYLFDLNLDLIKLCFDIIGQKPDICQTDSYIKDYTTGFSDFRNKIHQKKENGIIDDISYYQLFGDSFVSNLSILDLLFNEGTNAYYILNSHR